MDDKEISTMMAPGRNQDSSDNMIAALNRKWQHLLSRQGFNQQRAQLNAMPNMTRQSVKPHAWYKKNKPKDQSLSIHFWGSLRRLLLFVLIIGQTIMGAAYLTSLLPYQGWAELSFANDWQINPMVALENITPYVIEAIVIGLFAILFAWISIGFWTAMMGILVTLFGGDRYTIKIPQHPVKEINRQHRTALVMPICNEDVARVFAGLKATWQSLKETGQLELCDFYVLSDTNDPDVYVNELNAWAELVNEMESDSQVFYRHRERRVKRKSGNIDDFCRRFGNQYEYMIILDADSVMTGDCIVNMIAMMEMTPKAGIIQSPPKTIRMRTLYGRIQQFANQTYSDIFSSGVHYWQLSEAQYWGHNAIIRLAPFIEHCLLTPFKKWGQPHHILSHDLVEAALMRSAGWQVWIAYNLSGSYEEVPANMIEDLKRDNRWCMGNLINLRVLFKPGIRFIHRIMFITSAMAYVSSLLWLLFLFFSTLLLLMFNVSEPQYFLHPNQLYPVWPQWNEALAINLLCTTFVLLLAPKLVSYVIVLFKQKPKALGGIVGFTCSIVLEILFSVILAPIRMIFHSKFVIKALMGSKVQWKSPARSDDALTWREAVYFCWPLTLLGIVWLWIVLWLNPQFTTWFIAILVPLIISPLVIKYSSLTAIGLLLQRKGLFITKDESMPNQAIIDTDRNLQQFEQYQMDEAYQTALTDESLHALVCAMSTRRHHDNLKNSHYRQALLSDYLSRDASTRSKELKLKMMADPQLFKPLFRS
ncbi:glucans biosynthesis glucosyltransferase MdoH [Utexia brackfieldae]|uniref:glucans biosynthesis glucosyltransferase MdoH n=1 Tax=Utexia brackfieldae TaxID=3074108 RepID=UPI00370DBC37